MSFQIRKFFKQNKINNNDNNNIINSINFLSSGSKKFKTTPYIILHDYTFSNGLTFNSSNPLYDDAFFVLQLLKKEIDDSIAVISIEDGALPILRVHIAGHEHSSRGIVIDMSDLLHEIKLSTQLKMFQTIQMYSLLFFILSIVIFTFSFPETRILFLDYFQFVLNYIQLFQHKNYSKNSFFKPSLTFQLW